MKHARKTKKPTKSKSKAAKGTQARVRRSRGQPMRAQYSHDHIRIVPLHPGVIEAAAAPAGPPPNLTYRGGPLLNSAEVFTLFWGNAWQNAQRSLVAQINQFFSFILSSSLIDQLSEYDVPNYKIQHGQFLGTVTSTPTLGSSISDSAIQQTLQQMVGKAGVPKATANTLFFIYLPPGVRVVMGGSASCQSFCGYHNHINGQIFYAVMPFPSCQGCLGPLSQFDALTSTSSHELCEAITDAIPGQGWYDDRHGEIGDICAWKTKTVGNYTVQQEWSNKNGCT